MRQRKKQYLLYVDLLGVRARWHVGGRAGAEAAFAQFQAMVGATLKTVPDGKVVVGAIESDSAALLFDDAYTALRAGRDLFRSTFLVRQREQFGRPWMRGTVVPFNADEKLRIARALPPPHDQVQQYSYGGGLLDAVSVEKSGVKGMRLIVHDELTALHDAKDLTIRLDDRTVMKPLSRLTNSVYPGRLAGGYQDFLWMADGEMADLNAAMNQRLRWAAGDPEEFLQAAATQVVFHECQAIIWTLRNRRPKKGRGKKKSA